MPAMARKGMAGIEGGPENANRIPPKGDGIQYSGPSIRLRIRGSQWS